MRTLQQGIIWVRAKEDGITKKPQAFLLLNMVTFSFTTENAHLQNRCLPPWPSSLPQGSWLASKLTWWWHTTTMWHPQSCSKNFKSSLVQKVPPPKLIREFQKFINRVYMHRSHLLISCTPSTGQSPTGPTRKPQPAKQTPRYNRYCTIGYNDIA